jgi:hypothetical protein
LEKGDLGGFKNLQVQRIYGKRYNHLEDPEFARLMAQGDLIMEVTETLCELLEKEKIFRKELADRLGKTKGFVSQLLNGGRNLTLRTVADILHVLGYRASLTPFKKGGQRQGGPISTDRSAAPHEIITK